MKYINLSILVLLLLAINACTIDDQADPNGPSINSVLNNASRAELNLLVSGTEAAMREGWDGYVTAVGSIAREMYLFDADPRNTEDLLGKEGTPLDANTFYLTGPYNTRYRVVKNCNLLLQALDNTSSVSEAEKDGYRAFANTIKGLMLFQVLNMLNDNGIRVDVADPKNLGPFVTKAEAFTAIRNLLDEGYSQLNGAGFAFSLSTGFAGFDTPATFGEFNRALAAKVALYAGDNAAALTHLNNSFFDINGDLKTGPKHVFSTASGDILNPVYKAPGQSGDQIIVHNYYLADAEAGDDRLAKFGLRVNPTSQDGLNGTHETRLYATNVSPIDIIRNEELILIYAEASARTDKVNDALTAINRIRIEHGLNPFQGTPTADALLDDVLFQRRYSFWSEGQYMFDLRRFGRLNATFLPIDRPGDIIHTQFPIPLTEGQ